MAEEILGQRSGEETDAEEAPSTALTSEETTDDKTEETTTSEAAGVADDTTQEQADGVTDASQDGVPTEYEAFTLPEGMTMDDEALASVLPVFKEVGMSQETAQKLIDVQVALGAKGAEAQRAAWADQQDQWRRTAEGDTEFGKGKYDESIGLARRALREVGTPELSKVLDDSGMGNHPEFIRFFWRIGKAIGEDNINFGSVGQEGGKSIADRLFPNQGKAA